MAAKLLRLTIEENAKKAEEELKKRMEERAAKPKPPISIETWKIIPNFPEYMVSDAGRVIHRATRDPLVIMPPARRGGYRVTLFNEGKRYTASLHRLVAAVYHPEYRSECVISHKDGDRSNNHISNLVIGRVMPNYNNVIL